MDRQWKVQSDNGECPAEKEEGISRVYSSNREAWYGVSEEDGKFIKWYSPPQPKQPMSFNEPMNQSKKGTPYERSNPIRAIHNYNKSTLTEINRQEESLDLLSRSLDLLAKSSEETKKELADLKIDFNALKKNHDLLSYRFGFVSGQ